MKRGCESQHSAFSIFILCQKKPPILLELDSVKKYRPIIQRLIFILSSITWQQYLIWGLLKYFSLVNKKQRKKCNAEVVFMEGSVATLLYCSRAVIL